MNKTVIFLALVFLATVSAQYMCLYDSKTCDGDQLSAIEVTNPCATYDFAYGGGSSTVKLLAQNSTQGSVIFQSGLDDSVCNTIFGSGVCIDLDPKSVRLCDSASDASGAGAMFLLVCALVVALM